MSDQRPWHRLFVLSWTDFCEGSALRVFPEVDLSMKQQFLDMELTRQGSGPLPQPLPDGFEDLATYNILTFKSHQEALTSWALKELIGHYVNFRKQRSETMDDLLPESDFRLYAVCVRFPRDLAQQVNLTDLRPGVYDLQVIDQQIRIIVVQELPEGEQNALLHLFSSRAEQVRYGREHYKARTRQMTTLFYDLIKLASEDPEMSKVLEEYAQKRIEEILKELPYDKRMEGIPAEKRLEGLSGEELMQALSPEQRAAMEMLMRQPKTNDLP
jgi:hypothetical protein